MYFSVALLHSSALLLLPMAGLIYIIFCQSLFAVVMCRESDKCLSFYQALEFPFDGYDNEDKLCVPPGTRISTSAWVFCALILNSGLQAVLHEARPWALHRHGRPLHHPTGVPLRRRPVHGPGDQAAADKGDLEENSEAGKNVGEEADRDGGLLVRPSDLGAAVALVLALRCGRRLCSAGAALCLRPQHGRSARHRDYHGRGARPNRAAYPCLHSHSAIQIAAC